MSNPVIFFTETQGLLLIKLLLAQIISDFVLQSDAMVKSKNWFSGSMFLHIGIVFLTSGLLSGLWWWSLAIAASHWLIDSIKMALVKRAVSSELVLFIADQFLHILVIVGVWCYTLDVWLPFVKSLVLPFWNYSIGLILLGYVIVIWPIGFLIRLATQNMAKQVNGVQAEKNDKIEHGGKLIGQFERIIILTFVLLGQYEAIGFLITGKSIIRFAQKDENLRSEYVLLGTMMSYAFSILIGALINWLLSLTA
jgi:hypothetical protein